MFVGGCGEHFAWLVGVGGSWVSFADGAGGRSWPSSSPVSGWWAVVVFVGGRACFGLWWAVVVRGRCSEIFSWLVGVGGLWVLVFG